ncbi:sensory box histidine kinase/response regulator [hydrothermal vent metagenome]|uniref:Sensory box histidine kinase/response regulator n=1 Tax=hydrothermal vent metagenome TaxID=652676 RepID=A0A1W1CEL9_9ZZZZ
MLRKIKILITEDKKINQEILMGILEDSGLEIDIACNGKEAVQRCRETRYALILMDIEMPIMNGYEATKIIRAENMNIPIIALTANNTIEDICKTKAIGMNEHLCKPVEPRLLYKTFSKYINAA